MTAYYCWDCDNRIGPDTLRCDGCQRAWDHNTVLLDFWDTLTDTRKDMVRKNLTTIDALYELHQLGLLT